MKRMLRHTAFYIAKNPGNFGMEKLTKTDVLEIIRAYFPESAKYLPTSKEGLRLWWASVDVPLEQGRGYADPGLKKKLNEVAVQYKAGRRRQEKDGTVWVNPPS